jgi:hypothetical protein
MSELKSIETISNPIFEDYKKNLNSKKLLLKK